MCVPVCVRVCVCVCVCVCVLSWLSKILFRSRHFICNLYSSRSEILRRMNVPL